jgi:type II secretory pathway pseudopilin PulG
LSSRIFRNGYALIMQSEARAFVRPQITKLYGFTMIETTVSIALVSILLIGSLSTFAYTTNTINRDMDGLRALGLAEDLFSEISTLHFVDPVETTTRFGRESTETSTTNRSAWDDLDDYNGLSESTLRYRDGTAIPNLSGWTRQVTVTGINPSTLTNTTNISEPLRLITITLQKSSSRNYTYQFFVSRDGFRTQRELASSVRPVFQTQWQLGNRNYYFGVPLRNMPLAQ